MTAGDRVLYTRDRDDYTPGDRGPGTVLAVTKIGAVVRWDNGLTWNGPLGHLAVQAEKTPTQQAMPLYLDGRLQ